MIYFPNQEPEDVEMLQGSFDALSNQADVTIISDAAEIDRVFKIVVNTLTLPSNSTFSVLNLFQIKGDNGSFYIIQCMQDYRSHVPAKGFFKDHYEYRVLGFAELHNDYGDILIRPETKADRIVGRFFKSDIQLKEASEFNKKYYFTASDSEKAKVFVNAEMVKVLANANGVHLTVQKKRVFVSSEFEMANGHAALFGRILGSITSFD